MSRDAWMRPRGRLRFLCALTLGVLVSGGPIFAAPLRKGAAVDTEDLDSKAYSGLTLVTAGASESAVRDQARSSFPMADVPTPLQAKVREVLRDVALFRHLPTLEFAVDPRVYGHLISHPDVAVSSWRAMEISRFQLKDLGQGAYHADALDGSVGNVEVCKSTPTETIIYCDGAFKSPVLAKPIVARSVMRLQTEFFKAADGESKARHTGDVFVAFPSQTVETVARLISPVSHSIADRNFRQLTLYVHLISTAMAQQPEWVATIVQRMDAPDRARQEFLTLSTNVRRDYEARRLENWNRPAVAVDDVLAPLRENLDPPTRTAGATDGSLRR